MSHQVIREHRHLEDLFAAVSQAFASDPGKDRQWETFERLSDELQTHFEQEDRLYFPAIWALCPEFKSQLQAASGRHPWFCDQLRKIAERLEDDDKETAVSIFQRVEEAFRAHEESEEQILTCLDAALQA